MSTKIGASINLFKTEIRIPNTLCQFYLLSEYQFKHINFSNSPYYYQS
jgi:hypothetical protein